jgi:hypothetical protein
MLLDIQVYIIIKVISLKNNFSSMIMPEGLMHRKINILVALFAIIFIAVIAAYAISVKAAANFGGRITKVTQCVLDTPSSDPVICTKSCPLCTGLMGTSCAQSMEVVFKPSGGAYTFICPSKSYKFKRGGIPKAGSFILGNGPQVLSPIQSW